ncbi:MAG: ABC transporter permease [Thermomicrobiales bacterium]|nr:ABC transporter permease [Thermomicrobiales bacterium]
MSASTSAQPAETILVGTPQRLATQSSLARQIANRLSANPVTLVGLALAVFLIVVAVAAPLIAPHDPIALNPADRLLAPSTSYWFGTDDGGRDVFSRVVFGARYSLLSAAVVLTLAIVIGTTVGLVAGYAGGKVDEALMRLTDMFLAFPALVLAMGISAALGPSLVNSMGAIAIVWWPWYARLVRGQTLRLRSEQFVDAARTSGASDAQIVVHHILPNCLTPIIVQASLDVGYAILTTASLSFIGLGAQPPTPEWGAMVATGKNYILDQWWMATFPGFAIFLSVMAFNLLGDGLQEALSPVLRRR